MKYRIITTLLLLLTAVLLIGCGDKDKTADTGSSETKGDTGSQVTSAPAGSVRSAKITTLSSGMYAVPLSDLQAAGLDVSNPSELNVTYKGEAVSYSLLNEQVVFYADKPTSRYAPEKSFVITNTGGGTQMVTGNSSANGGTA